MAGEMQATVKEPADERHDDIQRQEREHTAEVDARPVESGIRDFTAHPGDRYGRRSEQQPPQQEGSHDLHEPAPRHARTALERLRRRGAFEDEDRHRVQPARELPGGEQPVGGNQDDRDHFRALPLGRVLGEVVVDVVSIEHREPHQARCSKKGQGQ